MDREKIVRDSERAAIERWFPASPVGPVFDPGDGKLLPIRADAAPAWKAEGFAIVDRYLAASRNEGRRYAIVLVALLATLTVIGRLTHFGTGALLAAGTAVAMLVLHGWSAWRLRRFRGELAGLRGRIRASLAGRTPLPAELATRYRRFNHWRTALQLWVGAVVLALLVGQHFLTPEQVSPAMVLAGLAAVGLAWALHFLAQAADRARQG